jgi:pimeloyl-ACP methyl ester carboxylesterase
MSSIEVVTVGKHRVAVQRIGNDPNHDNVILVNGALATTKSFRQVARSLCDDFNMLMYDLPYSGMSRPHNDSVGVLTKDDEAQILTDLIARYDVRHVCSMSWGGVANLLALSTRPKSVRNAIVASFSPRMNPAMREYVEGASRFLAADQVDQAADLLNRTVGRYLPRLLKLANHKHIVGLEKSELAQVHFHVRQLLALDVDAYLDKLSSIDVPVLFLNGREDAYTTEADVREFQTRIRDCHFASIPDAGHFLELEGRTIGERVRQVSLTFLRHSTLDRTIDRAAERPIDRPADRSVRTPPGLPISRKPAGAPSVDAARP